MYIVYYNTTYQGNGNIKEQTMNTLSVCLSARILDGISMSHNITFATRFYLVALLLGGLWLVSCRTIKSCTLPPHTVNFFS
jgi:hypothetical protein